MRVDVNFKNMNKVREIIGYIVYRCDPESDNATISAYPQFMHRPWPFVPYRTPIRSWES